MKTILKILMISSLIFYTASCSKEGEGFDSKYSGTYYGNVTVQTTHSGQLYCKGIFKVNSDGSIKGEVYDSNKTYQKTYNISKGYIKKLSDTKYTSDISEFGYKTDFIFIFSSDSMNIDIKDYNEGSTIKGNLVKK